MMMEMELSDDETASLVSQSLPRNPVSSDSDRKKKTGKRICLSFAGFLFLGCSLGVSLPVIVKLPNKGAVSHTSGSTSGFDIGAINDGYPHFTCPALVEQAQNVDDRSFKEAYTNISQHIMEENITQFLEGFRERDFDGWGETYGDVKAGLRDWKAQYFANNLKDGDSIFESACGIGLNLVMTLEVVQELKELKNVKVYGNEYVLESAKLANDILDYLLPQMDASKGVVCQGDSTSLHFVPSNSMDVVFTGYISTLLDPLNFNMNDIDANYRLYEHLCAVKKNAWEAEKLVEIMQERQEDWFGLWVSEMVRIAKPGASVIVEQVSVPYCNDIEDWGGVPREFWKTGVEKYGWDIDPTSIAMQRDQVFKETRYHVFMRKNGINDDS
jgi:hypothetical protein